MKDIGIFYFSHKQTERCFQPIGLPNGTTGYIGVELASRKTKGRVWQLANALREAGSRRGENLMNTHYLPEKTHAKQI